ncbi:MAG: CehA/McbA family metallohydrolase [Tepidisphaeraceae bacterium]
MGRVRLFRCCRKRPAGIAAFNGETPATQPAEPQPVVLRPTARPAVVEGLHVYFGNLHAHTANSDGTGTPDEAFAYARDVAKLDFLAVTEHNHLLGGDKAKPEQRAALYQGPGPTALLPAAAKNDRPGSFVAIYGQEFSSMSKGNHVNLFDVPQVIDVPNGKFDGLLDWMKTHKDSTGQTAVVQFNHPGLSFPPNVIAKNEYGRDDFGNDAEWIKRMGEVTSLIELLNGEPEAKATFGRSPQIMESDFRLFLREGFKLAPTGNQDNHHKLWGSSTDSRTGVIAGELTKPSLLTAMRQRHTYASEDKNLVVIVTVNNKLAGDVLGKPGPLDVAIHISDPDERAVKYTIEAVRGSIKGPAAEVVATATLDGNMPDNEYRAFDGLSLTAADQFLYFRITQVSPQGTDRAWTAPVWAN